MADSSESGADVGTRRGSGNWSGNEYETLADEELFPVASPDFCHEHRLDVTGEDLDRIEKLTLLHDRDPQASWEKWREAFDLGWLYACRGPRYASSDLFLNAASQGLAAAFARGRLAVTDIEVGKLIRLCGSAQVAVPSAYWI
ncbi:MAG: LysR substrate-binding domain-containing protein [Rhizobiaceae bacterium]